MAPQVGNWFALVFHYVSIWDAGLNVSQATTTEWYAWANAQNLQLGEGSWGRSTHGWMSNLIYPAGHCLDGAGNGDAWVSLQDGNVGHSPSTSPAWWAPIAEPGIGGDSALFTATAGTTKLSGWNQTQVGKLSGHLFSQAPGVNTLIYATPTGGAGQFIGKSDGIGFACLRMSLTADTCYAFGSEADGYGSTIISFYKVTNGAIALVHSAYVLGEYAGFGIRYRILGSTLTAEYGTGTSRTNAAYKTIDPLDWQPSYATLTSWTDPDPIPALGHEYVGFRVQDGTGNYLVTHQAFGGSLDALTASVGAPSGAQVVLSGSRVPDSTVTVTP